MNYFKAIRLDDFIIFSTQLSEKELKEFEENESIIHIVGEKSSNNIRFKDGRYYLYEWKEYSVLGTKRKPLSQVDFNHFGSIGRRNTGTILFKNYVGLSKFRNQLFNIESQKMESDTVNQLISIIDERVNETISMNFSSQGISKSEFQKSVERYRDYYLYQKLYNSIKKDKILPFINRVERFPNRQFQRSKHEVSISTIQDISEDTLIDIFSGQTPFAVLKTDIKNKNIGNYLPETVNEYYNQVSIDTNENRFVKFFITYCINLITEFTELLTSNQTSNKILIEELTDYRAVFQKKLNSNFFKEVSSIDSINYSSTTLTKQFGYKQLYQEYVNLKQSPFNLFDTKSLVELFENKSVDKLYEYICLFRLVDIVEGIYKNKPTRSVEIKNNNLFTVAISEENGGVEFIFNERDGLPTSKILFQHSFNKKNKGSYSVEFKPDFTLEILNKEGNLYYHFDSKFRVSQDLSSKNDDIAKMNSYRDGIKNTIGAVVLFPGNKSDFYEADTKKKFSGVGAYPVNINSNFDSKIKELLEECLTIVE